MCGVLILFLSLAGFFLCVPSYWTSSRTMQDQQSYTVQEDANDLSTILSNGEWREAPAAVGERGVR